MIPQIHISLEEAINGIYYYCYEKLLHDAITQYEWDEIKYVLNMIKDIPQNDPRKK